MDYIVSATTDIGISKETNQDSFVVRVFDTSQGKMVLAVLCDGMGGLANGEVASSSVINAFIKWTEGRLSELASGEIMDSQIRAEWTGLAVEYNEKIKSYAATYGTNMGTTLSAILLTNNRYYAINVGDTRIYEISDFVKIITKDQTLVAREVELGLITPEQAKVDPRRSVLLQCVGASENVYPDMFFGDTKENAVYMLCSDGFRHEITQDEIYQYLNPYVMTDANRMKYNMDTLINLNKQRLERDNITVVSIRTF